jgi:DNA polymerase/3'-5' exonuclease PolX
MSNKILSDKLNEIAQIYYLHAKDDPNNKFRSLSYKKAADIVKHIDEHSNLQNIPGIGKSIAHDINEFYETSHITRLDEMHNKYSNKEEDVLKLFMSIYGVGPSTANKWYQKGYRTIKDIYHLLSEKQQLAYYYRKQTRVPIERSEMKEIEKYMIELFDPIFVKLVGSYRRRKDTSNDIDLLVENGDIELIKEKLAEQLLVILGEGNDKLTAIWRYSKDYNAHRLDVRVIPSDQWPYALMYFTGSKEFNIYMRKRAQSMGLKLSEYGLFDELGISYHAEDENDIFRYLELDYISPQDR